MMFKKAQYLLATVAAGISMMFASCGDNVVDPGRSNPVARLNIVVRDAVTNTTIEGATVKLLTEAGTLTRESGANGTASFDDVAIGDYRVDVEKTGYAGVTTDVTISRQDNLQQDSWVVSEPVHIYPQTASLSGNLFYRNDLGEEAPAAGATVRITLDETIGLINGERDVTVTANGSFTLSNLPANVSYRLTALNFTKDGNVYPGFEISGGQPLQNNTSSIVPEPQYYGRLSTFRYTGGPELTITSDQAVTLTFSETLVTGPNPFTYSPATQAVNISFAANTIVLTPVGGWGTATVTISMTGSITSAAGNTLNTFGTPAGTVKLTISTVDLTQHAPVVAWIDSMRVGQEIPRWTSNSVPMRWNSVVGATHYDIYRRNHGETEYTRIEENVTDTFAVATLLTTGTLEDKTIGFVIRAANRDTETPIVGATAVEVFSRPTVKTPATLSNVDTTVFSQAGSTAIATALTGTAAVNNALIFDVVFTEDMKTNVTIPQPTLAFVGNNPTIIPALGRINATATWVAGVADPTMRVSISIAVGTAVTAVVGQDVEFRLSIGGLESALDKPLFVEYTINDAVTPTIQRKVIKHAVDMRVRFQTGTGGVTDPCIANPQSSPTCPGYIPPTTGSLVLPAGQGWSDRASSVQDGVQFYADGTYRVFRRSSATATWDPFVNQGADGGTYTVSGNTLTHSGTRIYGVTAGTPTAPTTFTFTASGDTLTFTSSNGTQRYYRDPMTMTPANPLALPAGYGWSDRWDGTAAQDGVQFNANGTYVTVKRAQSVATQNGPWTRQGEGTYTITEDKISYTGGTIYGVTSGATFSIGGEKITFTNPDGSTQLFYLDPMTISTTPKRLPDEHLYANKPER